MIDTLMSRALEHFLDVNAFRHGLITSNMANVDTPGFSRQRSNLTEGLVTTEGQLTFGTGVDFTGVTSVRDAILEIRIQQERQQQGTANAFVQSMSQAQVMFSDSSGDIGSKISAFFSSLQSLSTDPSSLSLRQGVLSAAGNLASAFRTSSQNLTAQRNNLDLSVGETVEQINVLTSQIANLNAQITTMQNLHQEPSAFIDQRDALRAFCAFTSWLATDAIAEDRDREVKYNSRNLGYLCSSSSRAFSHAPCTLPVGGGTAARAASIRRFPPN
jgi:flagellar hook-associated protein 1 FlgK